jgi:hypothetical protein
MRQAQHRGLKTCRFVVRLLPLAAAFLVLGGVLIAQSSPQPSSQPAAPVATLNQLMRGLFFPHSNVIFATQRVDPADIKRLAEPSTSTDPLTGVFGNWEAVEDSALVLSESADFLMTPGRKCSNGKDMPLDKPDWIRFVNQLREAGMVAYKAAQTKNMDNMIQASDVLNTACANCHNRYRARNRCQ